MGVVLVVLVLMSFTQDLYEPPELVTAGTVSQYEPGEPKLFEAEKIWMVRLPETDEMLALSGPTLPRTALPPGTQLMISVGPRAGSETPAAAPRTTWRATASTVPALAALAASRSLSSKRT
jgi:hypothetical protein